MNKLFVYTSREGRYFEELNCAKQQYDSNAQFVHEDVLSVDVIEKDNIGVIVTTGLSKQWYKALKGMDVVTITLGKDCVYEGLSDIVIDCFGSNKKMYFSSEDYLICNNDKINFNEIFNIITKLNWDSGFFGFNIAYLSCLHLTSSIWSQSKKFVDKNNIKLIEYLCNCHDARSVRLAEKNGFHFVDIRLNFVISLNKMIECKTINSTNVKQAQVEDIPVLRSIAENIYKDSRYFFDGNFDENKVNEFYQSWVEKAVKGEFDDECWCLYEENVATAFCTVRYHVNDVASIGLVGVSSNSTGKGHGKNILASTLKYLKNKGINSVNVVTQGRNYAAQNLYQSVGFRINTSQLWYHKWA